MRLTRSGRLPRLLSGGLTGLIFFGAIGIAHAQELACSALFQGVRNGALAPHSLPKEIGLPVEMWRELNEPSQDYLVVLRYLITERRLLSPEIYQKVIGSSRALNPLVPEASGLTLFPYRAAFDALLRENLQWDKIREAARLLGNDADGSRQREQAAKQETERVLFPSVNKVLPFQTHKVVQTSQGRVLAVSVSDRVIHHGASLASDGEKEYLTEVAVFELPSATEVARLKLNGQRGLSVLDVREVGGRLLAVLSEPMTGTLHILDLLNAKELPHPDLSQFPAQAQVKFPLFIEDQGQARMVTFVNNQAVFFDPDTGLPVQKVPFSENRAANAEFAGVFTGRVFVSDSNGHAVIMSPASAKSVASIDDHLWYLNSFYFQGRILALVSERVETPSAKESGCELRAVDVESGKMYPAFKISRGECPELRQTFEQDGKVFALFYWLGEHAVVDLVEGKVLTQTSQTSYADRSPGFARARPERNNGFDFKGRHYLLGHVGDAQTGRPNELTIFDSLTLEPVLPTLKLPPAISEITVLPPIGEETFAVVRLGDLSSRLISLTKLMEPR